MRTGFVYWHPLIYHYMMRFLYGKGFRARYEAIVSLLPDYSEVVDVCCGDCYINSFLREKKINYLGLDLNPKFVEYALKRGIKARLFDLETCSIPKADYIIMQSSLYQFVPHQRVIINKLFSAANKAVIISESIKNITSSSNPMVSFLASLVTRVKGKNMSYRFTKTELLNLFRNYNVSLIKEIEGGRDLVCLFKLKVA